MVKRENIRGFPNSEEFEAPQSNKNIWPHQYCPVFDKRHTSFHSAPECFYCKYADFHIEQPVALDVGICCYPNVKNN